MALRLNTGLVVRAALACTCIVALAGCEAMMSREDDPVTLRLNELDTRLARVERVVNSQALVALKTQLDGMQTDIASLRNDIENLQHEAEQANVRQRDQYLDIDQRLQTLETAGVAAASDLNVFEGGTLNPGQLPVPGGTDRANYQAAFELLKQGRYDQAAIALQQFLIAFPQSDLRDNAQYWLAETFYVTHAFKEALPAFQTVLEQYPDSSKIPDALLKIGYCNYELGRIGNATQALRQVVARYPETTAARLASQRLERIDTEKR